MSSIKTIIPAIVILVILSVRIGAAQELVPRAYQPAPVGLNAFSLSYTFSTGDIVFDPAVPIKDAGANLHFEGAGYYRTFGFFGRFANATITMPYAVGHLNGTVFGERREIYRSGLGDARARFAVNLKGTPALTFAEFPNHKQETNIGVSLTVSAPTGQYDPAKVINIGQNRWAFKPEVAFTKLFGTWQLDIYGGAWFFTENDNFTGKTLTQAPVSSFQFHLTRNIGRSFWIGVNANFYSGGRTATDGVESSSIQKNSRVGATLSVPIAKTQSVKIAISRGAIVSRGGNFTSLGASYHYAWR